MNQELPDVQARFRKGRGTIDQIANITVPILVAMNATSGVLVSPVVLLPATSIPVFQFKPHHLSHGSLQLLLAVLSAPLSCSPPLTSCTKP